MTTSLVLALASVTLFAQVPTSEPPAVTPSKPRAAEPPEGGEEEEGKHLASLSLDELIKRLPPAGSEWHWDRESSCGVEHPASVEMRRRVESTTLTDEQWRAVLEQTRALRYRSRWPKDVEYAVSLTVPRWLGITQIRVTPRAEGMRGTSAGELYVGLSGTFEMIDRRDARMGRAMGQIPGGTKELVFDIEIERGTSIMRSIRGDEAKAPAAGMLWKGTVTTPIELVESFEAAIPISSDASIDAAVRDAIGAGMRQWGVEYKTFPFVVVDPDCDKFPSLASTGLDIKVELLKGDAVLAESTLLALDADQVSLASSLSKAQTRYYGSANLNVDGDLSDTAGWKLRLTGQSKHLWMLWNAKQRWGGTIIIQWEEAVRHDAERAGPGGRGGEGSTPFYK